MLRYRDKLYSQIMKVATRSKSEISSQEFRKSVVKDIKSSKSNYFRITFCVTGMILKKSGKELNQS